MKLKKQDSQVAKLIDLETNRQKTTMQMIASENHCSPAVREALGSILTDKYAEGYPGKRYYGGNQFIDKVEQLCIDRAKKLFKVEHVNVQPYSGSPANFAVYMATCNPGETIMGLNLPDGGHLTHGWKVSSTAIFYKSISYHVREDGRIDFEELRKLALEHRPKLIWSGATAHCYQYDYKKMAEIADEVGAYFVADIAHVAGLIVGGVHTNPVDHAHIITTTTHKTLRGPRGGMIMVTKKGLAKDAELPKKLDKAIFPGMQGGPHENAIAAIAVCLKEAATPAFKKYAAQIVKNAKALAKELKGYGFNLVSGGTENHLLLLDLRNKNITGADAQSLLERSGISTNKNTIPKDPAGPFKPSGLRIGTPAITTRGMKEKEMKMIAGWINEVIVNPQSAKKISEKVKKLCKKFPLPK